MKINDYFEKINESLATINHNSTSTAEAMKRIAEATEQIKDAMIKGFSRDAAEHEEILKSLSNINKNWFKLFNFTLKVITIIAGAGLGLKLTGLI